MALRDENGTYIGSPLLGETKYEYDWFTGSQINMMIGDIVVDSCVGIQWDATQSKTPVYGYASQYYTFAADGKVLVQGAFTVAFKEAGYVFWPIKKFLNQAAAGKWSSPRYIIDNDGKIVQGHKLDHTDGTFANEARIAENRRVMRGNVEQMMEWQYGPTRAGALYNQAYRDLGALADDQFEDWAEVFEDVLWYGSDINNPLMRDKLFSNNLPAFIELANEDILSHRRADQYPPIDMWVTYGDMNRPAVNHTVKKIMDLSFVGQSQVIEVSGEPTYEVFHWIARNIV